MTVDMLAATFFWTEGAVPHVREDVGPDKDSEDLLAGDPAAADPLVERHGETFWATLLRQIGWPLPPKAATRP